MLQLYLLCILCQLSWRPVSAACNGFERVDGAADCVRGEFQRTLSGVCSPEQCALVCAPMATCQAFAPLPQCQCKLFLFDACSHRVQSVRDGCGVRATVYVRRLPGAAPGGLCPSGFRHAWFGTSYKVVDSPTVTWSDAKAACSAAGGLAKFADALDADETQWLLSIRSAGVSYHIGGHQTEASSTGDRKANWVWDACNITVDRSIWQAGQPDSGSPLESCACFYGNFNGGINDYSCAGSFGYICECQSVF